MVKSTKRKSANERGGREIEKIKRKAEKRKKRKMKRYYFGVGRSD
jgi:hypothetical protein